MFTFIIFVLAMHTSSDATRANLVSLNMNHFDWSFRDGNEFINVTSVFQGSGELSSFLIESCDVL